MKYTVKRKNELTENAWDGGSTTELFIFPPEACYKNRDFSARISCATVDKSPSEFTILPLCHRLLMPLSAPLRLVFDGQNEARLNPFEVIEFDGGLKTVSHGLCADIGIMLFKGYKGALFAAEEGALKCPRGFTGVYSLAENVKIEAGGNKFILNSGDFLLLETDKNEEITLNLTDKKTAAIAQITKNKQSKKGKNNAGIM